jgi:hypothetical protein
MLAGSEYRKAYKHDLMFVKQHKVSPCCADVFSHCYVSGDKGFVNVFLCVNYIEKETAFKQYWEVEKTVAREAQTSSSYKG